MTRVLIVFGHTKGVSAPDNKRNLISCLIMTTYLRDRHQHPYTRTRKEAGSFNISPSTSLQRYTRSSSRLEYSDPVCEVLTISILVHLWERRNCHRSPNLGTEDGGLRNRFVKPDSDKVALESHFPFASSFPSHFLLSLIMTLLRLVLLGEDFLIAHRKFDRGPDFNPEWD